MQAATKFGGMRGTGGQNRLGLQEFPVYWLASQGGGGAAHSVKCLPRKHQDLSSVLGTRKTAKHGGVHC